MMIMVTMMIMVMVIMIKPIIIISASLIPDKHMSHLHPEAFLRSLGCLEVRTWCTFDKYVLLDTVHLTSLDMYF